MRVESSIHHRRRRIMLLRYKFVAALLSAATPLVAVANIYTVGPGGGFVGCNFATVQAAVNAAAANPGPDEIHVAMGSSGYTNQAVVVTAQDLSIFGGYLDCQAPAATGHSRLSGSGGAAAPVVKIQSTDGTPVQITLDGLDLVDGDNAGGNGGGLRVQSLGEVHLSNMIIANNRASYGAGISVEGPFGDAMTKMYVNDNVQIEDNTTGGGGSSGGGIDVYQAYLSLGGVNTVVRRNAVFGDGGGIRVRGTAPDRAASADIRSGGQGGDGIIAQNSATFYGGGIEAADFSNVRLYTTDAARPVSVSHNSADFGGAIHAISSTARVTIWEGLVTANVGSQGAGAFAAEDGARIAMSPALFSGAPAGTVACPATDRCNKLSDNIATGNGGAGATVRNSVAGVQSVVFLDSAIISGNAGFSLFAGGCVTPTQPANCGSPASIFVGNSRVGPNFDAQRIMYNIYKAEFGCYLCTIASNSNGASTAPLFDTRGALELSRSIVWEPGRDVIGAHVPASVFAADLLLHDATDFPLQADIRVGDPRFIAQGAGDFRLAANSPALDSTSTVDAPEQDLDGRARVVDQAGIPDHGGPMDLGAYERASDTDLIFVHSFE
jgi:hypothetical protein